MKINQQLILNFLMLLIQIQMHQFFNNNFNNKINNNNNYYSKVVNNYKNKEVKETLLVLKTAIYHKHRGCKRVFQWKLINECKFKKF